MIFLNMIIGLMNLLPIPVLMAAIWFFCCTRLCSGGLFRLG